MIQVGHMYINPQAFLKLKTTTKDMHAPRNMDIPKHVHAPSKLDLVPNLDADQWWKEKEKSSFNKLNAWYIHECKARVWHFLSTWKGGKYGKLRFNLISVENQLIFNFIIIISRRNEDPGREILNPRPLVSASVCHVSFHTWICSSMGVEFSVEWYSNQIRVTKLE